ncbi:MAG: hypothetical protein CVV57_08690 [Tenericutes bacterium HGW-Tenericutes-2]|nr:MAG: hypothetical protein CVV57_08690 [Tenericutes bacterium HGW-Tenericutes-2]
MKRPYRHMPELIFGNYKLRTISKSDAPDMFDYGKDIEVTRYLNWGPFTSLNDAKLSYKKIFKPRLRHGLPTGYAIVDLTKNKMIGTIDFHSKIKGENSAEIGYCLHRDYWNQGIMSQAIQLIIKIGFQHLKYDLIRVKHLQSNVGSQKVIAKTQFKLIKKEPYLLEKVYGVLKDDMLIYELKREDYDGN